MTLAADHSARLHAAGRSDRVAARPRVLPQGLVAERVSGVAWDGLAVGFDGICQEQLFAYAHGRWPGLALEPMVFSRNGRVVGGALVMLQPLPLRLGTIALVKWGPVLAHADEPDAEALLRAMIGYLKAEYAVDRKMMLSVLPMVEPDPENRGFSHLMDMGFSRGEGLRAPERYVLDLRLDDAARMAAFGQKWRYHLRKGLKSGLAFERAKSAELDRFMTLYRAMSVRKRFADHSAIETVTDLFALPEGRGRPELFFLTHEGRTVAGAIVFAAGRTATYLYGATSDDALALRAGYVLHWHVLRWLRENTRARWYDLGGSDGSAGLHQFKSGMVGEAGYIHPLPPAANFAASPRVRLAGEAAYAARARFNRLRDAVDGFIRRIRGRLA